MCGTFSVTIPVILIMWAHIKGKERKSAHIMIKIMTGITSLKVSS
jgi:hypothetical protein